MLSRPSIALFSRRGQPFRLSSVDCRRSVNTVGAKSQLRLVLDESDLKSLHSLADRFGRHLDLAPTKQATILLIGFMEPKHNDLYADIVKSISRHHYRFPITGKAIPRVQHRKHMEGGHAIESGVGLYIRPPEEIKAIWREFWIAMESAHCPSIKTFQTQQELCFPLLRHSTFDDAQIFARELEEAFPTGIALGMAAGLNLISRSGRQNSRTFPFAEFSAPSVLFSEPSGQYSGPSWRSLDIKAGRSDSGPGE